MNRIQFLLALVLALSIGLFSCTNEEAVIPYVNKNLTDTTGINVNYDLFASGKIDGKTFEFFNGREKVLNKPLTYENGLCDSVGGYPSYIQIQATAFHNPAIRTNSIYIEIAKCITVDNQYKQHLKNMLKVGQLPILNLADSATGGQVKYYDENGEFWSSGLGNSKAPGNSFQISAVIKNPHDSTSRDIIFGQFSCDLYNKKGEKKKLRGGRFKARIGTYL